MLNDITKIFAANITVLVIPGVNFYLIINTAMGKNKKLALANAYGVTAGIMAHVLFLMM